jgi:hypothetical protein
MILVVVTVVYRKYHHWCRTTEEEKMSDALRELAIAENFMPH